MVSHKDPQIDEVLGLLEQAAKASEDELKQLNQKVHEGQHAVGSFFSGIKEEVHNNPWKIVGQVALYGFGIGVLLGSRRHGPHEEVAQ